MRGAQKTTLARQLRQDMTDAERALWRVLRDRKATAGHKFRRQHPIGPYVADFACLEKRLIVEADGGQHQQSRHDAGRDTFLRREGFRILRFWDNDILQNLEGVCDMILRQLSESTR
ncbi:endonuclease domain-containing protein [Luteimonas sp. SX5]|uniref:Endonuclease domain-containing protein n=1 Tax=Luteimonas galliterrae TaxID=2940486 RepID=A0ABT0MI48_9GAMM|nr:endonuclease domain-containing protein [Luteimonas galliterrae]MCL1634544.1 endonuclease domain-containing protein [Luteimonas galliterrae]